MNHELLIEIDNTIKVVCEKIKNDNGCSGEYAERVKALAALIEARTNVNQGGR